MPFGPAIARLFALALLLGLAACGGGPRGPLTYAPGSSSYPAPGPPDDPWGPYIAQASNRFGVPDRWIRAVMHQESGGHEYLDGRPITSSAGAMGLMQLMPDTYADLQSQYGLGGDPYDPHDNIMAGTGYIRQMYDKYGSPGFLAAYNAGPARVDEYLAGGPGLPAETVDYVAAITPNLGGSAAIALASNEPAPRPRIENGCAIDPDAAYDPSAPCVPAMQQVAAAATPVPVRAIAVSDDCTADPDAAFDPNHPCRTAPAPVEAPPPLSVPAVTEAAYAVPSPPAAPVFAPSAIGVLASAAPASTPAFVPEPPPPYRPAPTWRAPIRPALATVDAAPAPSVAGNWGIQVGAYGAPGEARFATDMARDALGSRLAGARTVIEPAPGLGGHPLYRARLAGLDRSGAISACAALRGNRLPCMEVAPGA